MGFRINTNIGAMNAHVQAKQTNLRIDNSLQKLSSGLRINKAADDSSGMAIADSLNSQALGLGQSITNANDGIGVVQTADGALAEYINIINTVRTKAIQAASDGQSAGTRAMIQSDVDKLLEEAQNIAATTSFNGQTLLNGSFRAKSFHIGAYSGETVKVDVENTQTESVGKFALFQGTSVAGMSAGAVDGVSLALNVSIGVGGEDQTFSISVGIGAGTAAEAKDGGAKSSLEMATRFADAFNTKAQTEGVGIRASVYEVASSSAEKPLYGLRLDSELTITTTAGDGGAITAIGMTAGATNAALNDGRRLSDIDVRTREAAELAVTITDYALKEIGDRRSKLGSAQQKLESTIRNISVTQVNVKSAESQIRDVDFAKESANFNKQNILAQSGTYAMSQANAIQQNVMRLLQ